MMICISGIPGTGKSTLADELKKRGYNIVRQNDTVKDFIVSDDEERDTKIIDEEKWVSSFKPFEGIIEGHLTHLLPCDLVVILRCRPDILKERLQHRGYSQEKVMENVEAEALDVSLIEALEYHEPCKILEIDTTNESVDIIATEIGDFMQGKIPPSHGKTDWSEYFGMII
ncbi:AAA family ATPase [Methanoplanus sp. FWC-SCC4]|uniref:Putative adenylate kinase n=1 Tax=Methanochimaera problematica TaxID=2609417 RepID=A0AA97I1P4_9EURY|nr:adenylate kinase family protein [Methanoplanus sp. FWC-SCC4]WOF15375.1 AAA family ATPase [Methanoplanus sp. FWC-SCC4]